jgi:hypothetical protein
VSGKETGGGGVAQGEGIGVATRCRGRWRLTKARGIERVYEGRWQRGRQMVRQDLSALSGNNVTDSAGMSKEPVAVRLSDYQIVR